MVTGTRDLRNEVFTAQGATGTWTSNDLLYLDGSNLNLSSMDTTGILGKIRDYVKGNL